MIVAQALTSVKLTRFLLGRKNGPLFKYSYFGTTKKNVVINVGFEFLGQLGANRPNIAEFVPVKFTSKEIVNSVEQLR